MKEILLTKGKVAIVDDEDYDRLTAMGKWCVLKGGGEHWYAVRNRPRWQKRLGMSHTIFMQNVVLGIDGCIDHKDRNGLNNQKLNLRPASHSQNQINQKTRIDNSSGQRGVCFDKARGMWAVKIEYEGKVVFRGRYYDYNDAVEEYQVRAKEVFGEFLA